MCIRDRVWVRHGAPSIAQGRRALVPTRAIAMNNKCLFFRGADGSLVERRWSGDKWKWFYHGLPEMFGALSSERDQLKLCLLYTSPSPRDRTRSRMPSSA
eukprot:TRINITY_DN9477_c0_g1_i1.p1 TRINITY_DN9477_c0_g1~~TRINITY_DN9477_c0_g1_i1.p1  ORF type:complete len:100 (+),score=34.28 TRINITY_DN9477_c0_g1_i1:112-411(+)